MITIIIIIVIVIVIDLAWPAWRIGVVDIYVRMSILVIEDDF